MYRHQNWHTRNRTERYQYRCYGRAPQRNGCGNTVSLAETEAIMTGLIFVTSKEPHLTKTWIKGNNWDAEIADTVQSIQELDPMSDDYDERHAVLVAQLREYKHKNETEATPGRWDGADTGKAIGEYFRGLDEEGKREYLKGHDIRVESAKLDESDAIHVVVDNKDYGIFSVWQEDEQLILEYQESGKPETRATIIGKSPVPPGIILGTTGYKRSPLGASRQDISHN
jgi:hypothetical protein